MVREYTPGISERGAITMNEPVYQPESQPQIDSRANLFYFLHTLSTPAGIKFHEESTSTNEKIETDIPLSGIALS
jgi:hypothetical protein